MKRILREPLIHFLLIGACLFIISGLRRHPSPDHGGSIEASSQRIVITPADVEDLSANFSNLWHRPPTAQELDGLIQGRIREEVYYREALKMGLDRDDAIIRGRLQEKLEFLSQDVDKPEEPTDKDMKSFLAAHPEKFRSDARLTFRLVFVDAGRHGASTVQYARRILARLNQDPRLDAAAIGDPIPVHRMYERAPENEVSKQFGPEFTKFLSGIQPGQWSGPAESEDGVYLIYLTEKIQGRMPPLDEVRAEVRKQWLAEQRQKANDKFYENLLRSYTVKVELPPATRTQVGIEPTPK